MSLIQYSPSKIRKLEKKLFKLETKVKQQSQELRTCKRRLSEKSTSVKLWKDKNKSARSELRALKARNKRLEAGLDSCCLPCGRVTCSADGSIYPVWLIYICIIFRVQIGLSYRCLARLLVFLNLYYELGLRRTPCANSIGHWVEKMGLFLLEKSVTESMGEELCLIVDESINIGQERLLLMLGVQSEPSLDSGDSAILSHQNVEVLGLRSASSMDSKAIAQAISKVQDKQGFQLAYVLSDRDAKLCKASASLSVVHMADISHLLASCLKKTV